MTALDHVVDTKSNQIAPAQLAIDSEVKESEFPGSMIQLQSNPDGPDLFQLQWRLLSEPLALIPGYCTSCGLSGGIHEWLLC